MRRVFLWLVCCVGLAAARQPACAAPEKQPALTVCYPQPYARVYSPVPFHVLARSASPLTGLKVYADNRLVYEGEGDSIQRSLPMSAGKHSVVVKGWNAKGEKFERRLSFWVEAGARGSCEPGRFDQEVTLCVPAGNIEASSPLRISAAARSSQTVTGMKVYVNDRLAYSTKADQVETDLPLAPGEHRIVVKAWESTGKRFSQSLRVKVR